MNVRRTPTSACAKRRLHVSALAQSIVHRPLASFTPPLLLLSPTNESTIPDVNMCRSDLNRSKIKHCAILVVRIIIIFLECHLGQKGHARGRVQCTVYKVLVCVEKDPFFSLDVPIRWLEPEVPICVSSPSSSVAR